MIIESSFLATIRNDPDNDALRLIFADWLEEQDRTDQANFIRKQITDGSVYPRYWYAKENSNTSVATVAFVRGFIESVKCSFDNWDTYGAGIIAKHPIQNVELTDAPIFESTGAAYFYVGGLGRFPSQYWSKLDRLLSRQAALDALSEVCIAWALHKVGITIDRRF